MAAQSQDHYFTPEEYLAAEDKADTKSEYYDGVIVAMPGASPEYCHLLFELTGILGLQLRKRRCQGFGNQLRVRLPSCNQYLYPAMAIVCAEPRYENIQGLQALLNPTLIVEVLSNSTEQGDRGNKFRCYQTLDSLQVYVLVAQYRPRIEVFTRLEDNSWRYVAFEGLDAVVPLPAIGCELRLTDVYARITFPPEPNENADAASDEDADTAPA